MKRITIFIVLLLPLFFSCNNSSQTIENENISSGITNTVMTDESYESEETVITKTESREKTIDEISGSNKTEELITDLSPTKSPVLANSTEETQTEEIKISYKDISTAESDILFELEEEYELRTLGYYCYVDYPKASSSRFGYSLWVKDHHTYTYDLYTSKGDLIIYPNVYVSNSEDFVSSRDNGAILFWISGENYEYTEQGVNNHVQKYSDSYVYITVKKDGKYYGYIIVKINLYHLKREDVPAEVMGHISELLSNFNVASVHAVVVRNRLFDVSDDIQKALNYDFLKGYYDYECRQAIIEEILARDGYNDN